MNEFVIWGKTNPAEEEKLLVTKDVNGNQLTDRKKAEFFVSQLEENFGCSECRIQEINMQYPENLNKLFVKTLK